MFVKITSFIICPEKTENPSTTLVIFYLPVYQLNFQVLVYLFVTNIQAGRPRVHDPSKISPDIAAPKQTIAETYNRDISTYNWPYGYYGLTCLYYPQYCSDNANSNAANLDSQISQTYPNYLTQAYRPRAPKPSPNSLPDIDAPEPLINIYNRDIYNNVYPYYVNPSDVNGQKIQPVGISQSLPAPAPGVQVAQDPNGKWFWYNVQIPHHT